MSTWIIDFRAVCFPSIAGQTRDDFRWIVICDALAPGWMGDSFADLRRTMPHLELRRHDPIRRGTLSPLTEGTVKALAPDGLVLTSRIDDDDCWSLDYVATLRRLVDGARPLIGDRLAVTFANGLEYDLADDSIRPLTYPWLSLAVHVLSPQEPYASAYSHSHAKTSANLVSAGWSTIVHAAPAPFWIYARHPDGDAMYKGVVSDNDTEHMAGAVAAATHARFGVSLPISGWAMEPAMELDAEIMARPAVQAIVASLPKRRQITRLDLKFALLHHVRAAAAGSDAKRQAIATFYDV